MNERLAETLTLQALWFLLRSSTASPTDQAAWRSRVLAYLGTLDPTPTQEEADYLASLFPLS